jgi:glutamine amidotransferase
MITVLDIGVSNISSVLKALKRENVDVHLTQKPEDINKAVKLIIPGVGAFGAGMTAIRQLKLYDSIRSAALERRIPLLGICLGMQLLAGTGRENGTHEGLGIIPQAEVVELNPEMCPAIPHMGWNNLESNEGNPLLAGLTAKPDFYFVHSYHMVNIPSSAVVNRCTYGGPIAAAIAYGNILGTQFHPEKSQFNGLKVLRNFVEYA